jgi:hypothetical protein
MDTKLKIIWFALWIAPIVLGYLLAKFAGGVKQ